MANDLMGQLLAQQLLRRGQRPSAQSLLAQRLMQQATDTSPTTGIGALARGLTGAFAGMEARRADEADTARDEAAFGRFQGHMNQQRDEASAFGARLRGAPPPAPAMPQASPQMPSAPPPFVPGSGTHRAGGPIGASPAVSPASAPPELMPHIEAASRETGIPVPLLIAQIRQESNFNPAAVGRAGEIGLAQIMPSTARQPGYGVQPADPDALRDPAANIRFGAQYLLARGRAAGVTDWNDPQQVARALQAYNGGGDPNYVQNVTRYLPGQGAPAPAPGQQPPAVGVQPPGQQSPGVGVPPAPPTQAAPQFDMDALREGLTHPSPLVREQALAAVQMLQLQRQQQRPPISVAPGSTLLDPNTHQPVYTAPQQPDSAERMLGRWRELSARGDQATPAEAQERDMLGARLRGSGTNITVGGAPQVGTIPPGYQITREGDSYRMEPIPGGPAARTLATEQGNALRSAEETVALIDGVLGHRALTLGTGLTGQLANAIPGTPTYDFGQRVAQLQGRAFLQAFESLKGGGQITEVEGRKATEAIARLSTAQSAEDFRTSLGELRAIVEQARIRAGGRPPEPQATVPGPNGGGANPPPPGGAPRVIEYDAQGRRVTR